ncbi:alpha/beta hydrolase [Aureliella helgolandensis]|uniref:Phospholipase/Carboxylesterase n=1 Tax=Aureliella helgolandensis TaxID=2527968 RepID=A0A518GDA4_9BACT|nr:phospholipase [Aureliella helgolandensis]QDV26581.1 Phospholipase/Carboxylesterase [Aureliella helgolandensis]
MNPLQYRAVREKVAELDCILVRPENSAGEPVPPRGLAVFCHGFGAGGDDLVGLASELLQIAAPTSGLALLFPSAPISLEEQGMPGARAWWLLSLQRLLSAMEEGRYEQIREEVPEGIEASRDMLSATIATLLDRYAIDESRLLLGGFSQGAMLAVETACYGLKRPPAQLCLYSGALICEKQWKARASQLARTLILQSHGKLDTILPFQTGLWLREMLEAAGSTVDFIEFNGPHTIPQSAIEKTAHMLAQLIND